MLKINELNRLYLGIQGENETRTLTVDVSAWIALYPNGSVTVWHKRNGESEPTATGAEYHSDDCTVTWSPTSTDTYVYGEGEAEFRLIENDVIKKTRKVITGVSEAVTLAGTTLGSDWASYINAVDSLRAGAVVAQEAAEDAQEAAEEAQEAAEDAQEAAEGAQAAAETAQGKAEDAQEAAEAAAARAEHASKVMVPAGGTEGQRLAKKSGTDFDMEWKTDPYYTKPAGGIPASDMAEGVIPDPEDLIDDTAGEGDTDKTWSADKLNSDVLSAINDLDEAIGFTSTASEYTVTTEEYHISSSDWTNQGCTNWGDFSDGTNPQRLTSVIFFHSNVLSVSASSGYEFAVYAWLEGTAKGRYCTDGTFKTSGGTIKYSTEFDFSDYVGYKFRIMGRKTNSSDISTAEGVNFTFTRTAYTGSDDEKIANLVSKGGVVELPRDSVLTINEPIEIDISKVKVFDGNNSTIIVCGDFEAIKLTGTLNTSANPNNITDKILKEEANTIVKNIRVTAPNGFIGTGIRLSKCFKTTIENVMLYKMKNGIVIEGYNRDLVIALNNIYAMQDYGIWFKPSCNLHQANFNGNIISYCTYCVYYDSPNAIANNQWTGNDIETSSYPINPTSGIIAFNAVQGRNNDDYQFSEIEILGNTIQGHGKGHCIEFVGSNGYPISEVSIIGNHISNFNYVGVKLHNIKNFSCSGNTCKNDNGRFYDIGNAIGLTITGETVRDAALFNADSSSSIESVAITGNMAKVSSGQIEAVKILGEASRVMIANNVCDSASTFDVEPSSTTKVAVINNISSAFTLGQDVVASGNIT